MLSQAALIFPASSFVRQIQGQPAGFHPVRFRQLLCKFRQLRLAAGHKQDIHATRGKLLGEGGAQALGGARNQRPFAVTAYKIAHILVLGRPRDGAETVRRLNPVTTPYNIAVMGRTVTHKAAPGLSAIPGDPLLRFALPAL